MNKKMVFILSCFFLTVSTVVAQTASIPSIKKVYLQSIKAIIENNEVKGYYSFYYLDKANKKENIYALNIMDNNLETVYSVEMIKDKNFILRKVHSMAKPFVFHLSITRKRWLNI